MKYPYALLVGLLGALAAVLPAAAGEKKVVGWIEKVRLSPGNFVVHAKLDSGRSTVPLTPPTSRNLTATASLGSVLT